MAIAFDHLDYRYPNGGAGIFDLSMTVADGELLVVIGPSGSGKTTLLKLLAGFLTPTGGRVLVNGRDVAGLPAHRRNLGVVFQSYALFQHMTALDNVAYPLKVRGVGRQERRRAAGLALDRVGLGDLGHRLPASLSGGQQQRVALARALVFEPQALLLDEPLSALDAFRRQDMRDEIVRVQRQAGLATVHVTHDLDEAMSMGDRVAVMRQGRLLQVAPPQVLYERPVDGAVARLVGRANLWPATVAEPGRVATSFGRLACDTADWPIGAKVELMVRPERLSVAPVGGEDNVLAGRLVRDRCVGPVRRFAFEVGGTLIEGEAAATDQAIGAVGVPPQAIRLLPARVADP
jgi:putative spermidine/putrescine transport system ATP-binding protein